MPYQHPDDIVNFSHLTARPEPHDRLFRNDTIESIIETIAGKIVDEDLRRMFSQCLPNTLDTTVYHSEHEGKLDTFVVTGDITAMWLRDSVNQVWPYLQFIKDDEELKNMFKGLIVRQARSIISDPYANAFKRDMHGEHVEVFERKWELDSLAAFFRLSTGYFRETNDLSPFDDTWHHAVTKALDIIHIEQNTLDKDNSHLLFQFKTHSGHLHPAIRLEGYGYPGKHTGMSRCVFRPSDDECVFPYLVPANAMAVVFLRRVVPILEHISAVENAKRARMLADQIDTGIKEHAIIEHKEFGRIYAYEADGFGSHCVMDDPNIPSLLSLPYLGYCDVNDETYQNTRKLILSRWNSFFAKGEVACGVTSPHVGVCDHFWPMATIMQALTSNDPEEIYECLKTLKNTHAGTFFMHESVDVDNSHHYTRKWFAWVNSLFGELVLTVHDKHPEILGRSF